MVKIALICFDNPFLKPMEGGKRGMLARIQALASCENYDTDVFLLTKPTEIDNDRNDMIITENIHYHEYVIRNSKVGLISKYPFSVIKRYIKSCSDLLSSKQYDYAIYEGEHVSIYRMENIVKAKSHVLYMHDIESEYRNELAKSEVSIIRRAAQKLESYKYKIMEKRLAGLFDKYMFVSIDELNLFRKRYPEIKESVYSPYALNDFSNEVIHTNNRTTILYVGNLKLNNNFLSIKWFAEKVLPKIKMKSKNIELKIIGDISDDDKKELLNIESCITVLGYVPSLSKEIENSCFIISPILYGAGVKVKIIDALAYGQIVVSNQKALEGTRLRANVDLIVEDSPDKLAIKCCDILQHREQYEEIARNGLEFVKCEHSIANHISILKSIIEE